MFKRLRLTVAPLQPRLRLTCACTPAPVLRTRACHLPRWLQRSLCSDVGNSVSSDTKMPAADMTEAEIKLRDVPAGDFALKSALADVADDYDYVLLDCPPALSKLTVNALVAADGVLIPMQCEYYALEGLSALMDTVGKIKRVINPNLEIEGLLRTMFDPRNNLSNDVSAQLESHFGDKVYRTIVPRNVRLAEAPSHGLPVMLYDAQSTGARAYLALAGEVLRRHDPRASRNRKDAA